jgi:tetratricopeptide (TPR) repeat protein
MKIPGWLLFGIVCINETTAQEPGKPAFMDLVREASENRFATAREAAENLLSEGRLDEANAAYINAIPENDMTAADCFVLGSVFFEIAPELSAKFHGRAFEMLPQDPYVNLEWAMILHRQGKHQEAIPCYQNALKALEGHYLPHVLLADCLIRSGDLQGAIQHWNAADHGSNSTSIDFAIHAIYGKLSPHLRHDLLIKEAKAGKVDRVDQLVALAANWDRDWWNQDTNRQVLERDLEFAKELLGEQDSRYLELKFYASTYQKESIDKKWLNGELAAHKMLLGEKGSLPQSGYVLDRLLSQMIKLGLEPEDSLIARYESELRKRGQVKGERGAMALNTLAALILESKKLDLKKLEEIDLLGWEVHHEERFAASYLASKVRQDELDISSPLLAKALEEFPESQPICFLAAQLAHREKKAFRQYLVRAIKAEFRHLSVSRGIIKDSYRLKSLFAQLENDLRDGEDR